MEGQWLNFESLEFQHFFQRLGKGFYPQALCALKGRECGPVTKTQEMKPLCRTCYIVLHAELKAEMKQN